MHACGTGGVLPRNVYLESGWTSHFSGRRLGPCIAFDGPTAGSHAPRIPLAFGARARSLADVISFGVAPAALAFAAGLDGAGTQSHLVYFVCCGVEPLAAQTYARKPFRRGAK